MQVQPYLFFDGRCEEAVEFYKKHLGAEVELFMRMKDNPDPQAVGKLPPGTEDKVIHAEFRFGDTTVMASDGMPAHGGFRAQPDFRGFSLTVAARDDDEAARLLAELSDGGRVQQSLIRTFFSSSFGAVSDRFGVSWMIVVA